MVLKLIKIPWLTRFHLQKIETKGPMVSYCPQYYSEHNFYQNLISLNKVSLWQPQDETPPLSEN